MLVILFSHQDLFKCSANMFFWSMHVFICVSTNNSRQLIAVSTPYLRISLVEQQQIQRKTEWEASRLVYTSILDPDTYIWMVQLCYRDASVMGLDGINCKYWYHCVTTALKIEIINLSDFTDLIVLNIQKVKQIHLSDFTNLIVPNIQNWSHFLTFLKKNLQHDFIKRGGGGINSHLKKL